MPSNDSHQHVVRTSAQWDACAEEYWVVPRGCLCVELTPKGKTKIKIGEGNKYYAQLPYITSETDLSQYYTKEEIDNLFNNLNRMAIMSTEEYDSRSDLPLEGNKLGDVRFVKTTAPSIKLDPDVYLWNGKKWIFVGYDFVDTDLSKYLKKEEFHELFDPVKEQVDEMYPKMHTHDNKQILDQITAPYTVPEKEKLAGLENYDDTEIREMIHESSHTHPNKPILDTITEDSLWSQADRDKFDDLHNYDDGPITERVEELEDKSHTHSNKTFLDTIMYPYQIWSQEDRDKFDSLSNPEVFVGTDGLYPGRKGLVPAPAITDIGKYLSSSGQWVSIESASDFIGATDTVSGVHGLVPAPLAGEQSYYLKGDGTWSEINIQEYKPGSGVSFVRNQDRYDEVEYIRYSGTERLYTGARVITGKLKAYIKWMWIDNSHGLCLFANTNDRNYINTDTVMGAFSSRYYDVKYGNSTTTVNSTRELRVIYEDELETVHRIYHRMNTSRLDSVNAFCIDREIWLFGSYNSGGTGYYGDRRIYAFKVWDDDVLILDMIPVRSSDNILGMYDRVSNTFKTIEHPENIDAGPDTGRIIGDFSEYVTNDGVLDITQENPLALNEITVHFNNTSKTLTIPSSGSGGTYVAGQGIEFTHPGSELYRVVEYIKKPKGVTVTTDVIPSGTTDFRCDMKYFSYTGRFTILAHNGERGSFSFSPPATNTSSPTRMWMYSAHERWEDLYLSSSSYSADPVIAHLQWGYTMSISYDHITDTAQRTTDILPGTNNVGFNSECDTSYYWAKFYENDILVGDLVPVIRDSDNAYGFFNKITNVFSPADGAMSGGAETGEVITIGDPSEKHITAKLGIGLTFDTNDAIELDDTIKIKLNCNNEPD